MQVTSGLSDHQLLSRQLTNVSVQGVCQQAGTVEARWPDSDWQHVGTAEDGSWQAEISGFTTEPRDLMLRIGKESCCVRDLVAGDIWVLAGQSNMAGDGRSGEPESPLSQVRLFDLADRWRIAQDPLHNRWESVYPIHSRNGGPTLRTGLGMTFGKRLFGHSQVPVGLVPCAKGATTLVQWSEFENHDSLYGIMLRRIAAAGPIAGVLWYQGESDATEALSPTYQERFQQFVEKVRSDMDRPTLPFYFVQIGRVLSFANDPNLDDHSPEAWDTIREAQRLAEQQLSHSGMVTAVDLELDNKIHISSGGLRRVGQRLADRVAAEVYSAVDHQTGPRIASVTVTKFGDDCVLVVTCNGVNGDLTATGRPSGFSLESGLIIKTRLVGNEVHLYLHEPLIADTLWYGRGIDPTCNIEDQIGQALPATGPLSVKA